jgi:hypothetical protein
MAEIVGDQAPLLKSAGFKKRRHSFNRVVSDGLVHVVHFWMAPKEPPAWTEVPGLRERVYGQFRLDFGVYVPEMTRMGKPRSDWISEYDCHLRQTCSGERRAPTDFGWDLDAADSSALAGAALDAHVLPWLARFPDRDAVLAAYEELGPLEIGLSPAGLLDVADVYRSMGRTRDERRTLEAYVADTVLRNHADYLRDYLNRFGHADLASRITTRDAR